MVETERPDDAIAIDGLLLRAFPEQPSVATMVTATRASPNYRPGFSLVERDAFRWRTAPPGTGCSPSPRWLSSRIGNVRGSEPP